MADGGRTIALLGVVGVGGFAIYEYTQYSHALSIINSADPTGAAGTAIETALPFTSWLMAAFGAPSPGTPAGNAYQLLNAALAGTLASNLPQPGTSAASGQPMSTSVSTAPQTTAPAPPAPPSTPQPTSADLQNALNTTLATADQWNFVYRQLTGYGIEQVYGGNFDAIYGAIGANGQRPTGQLSAQAFLTLPVAKGIAPTGLSGFGAIAQFYTPVVNPMGSMVYRAQHPSPYRLPSVGGGMGAVTQATGFEKALWAGGFIRSRRVR
jgi:hypothetical protein